MRNCVTILLLTSIVLVGFNACRENDRSPRETESFNSGWRFSLGDTPEASNRLFDDSRWRELQLPHDWAIEGDFSEDHPSGSGGGALPGGVGWYRKTFSIDQSFEGKKILIDFDGVYMNSDVWINGIHLGHRPFGYISFRYDLTPYLKYDEENVISVRVDNSEQPNSRWYSGCGIYRNVWLTIVDPVYVDLWGVYVTTPEVTENNALVKVRTTVKNETLRDVDLRMETSIMDSSGKQVASASASGMLAADSSDEIEQTIPLQQPVLWSLQNPNQYEVVTRIYADNKQTDHYVTPFGVRSFTFDAEKGFFLNGEHTKIKESACTTTWVVLALLSIQEPLSDSSRY